MKKNKFFIILFFLFISILLIFHSQIFADAKNTFFPEMQFKQNMHGKEAFEALNNNLPEVAKWYGFSSNELRKMIHNDKSLWIDQKGKLFYFDEFTIDLVPDLIRAQSENIYISAPFSYEQTFFLHSNPNSKKVLYLDFDGAVLLAGKSVWTRYNNGKNIIAPAWDIDGDKDIFSNTELEIIQNIWQRVAEDFAPFDVDVTTEQPSQDRITRSFISDEYFGSWVLISPIRSSLNKAGGGAAYVGAFNDIGDYYKPVLVFPENFPINPEKFIAEAISHEFGHNLGLCHDGTTTGIPYYRGQGDWAPIMGVGYYREITQWSKGEYANANNIQDDLSLIIRGGLSYRRDDYGNTLQSAAWLTNINYEILGDGIIERTTDVDAFKFFTNSGDITLNINPASRGANLNVSANLVDQFGNIIVSSNPEGQPITITTNLARGTYYLILDGVGEGDPLTTGYSDYGSLGRYFISGNINNSGNQLPIIVMSSNIINALTVQFFSVGSYDPDGGIVSFYWDFGDGTFSNLNNPTKIFNLSGSYFVTLTVKDNSNLTVVKSLLISV